MTTSCAPTPSSSASATSRRSRSASCSRSPTSTRCCARRSRPASGCRPPSRRSSSPTSTPSPALSQVGGTWPADGRMVGIVVDATDQESLDGLRALRREVLAAGMVPLAVRRRRWRGGRRPGAADLRHRRARSSSTRCSSRDAPRPAPDALAARDDKAGAPTRVPPARSTRGSPCWCRSASVTARPSAPGARGPTLLAASGVPVAGPGLVTAGSPTEVLQEVVGLLGAHRVWERFPVSIGAAQG